MFIRLHHSIAVATLGLAALAPAARAQDDAAPALPVLTPAETPVETQAAAPTITDAAPEAWTPTEDLLKELNRPFKSNDFNIQPPKGAKHKADDSRNDRRDTWTVETKGKHTGTLTAMTFKAATRQATPEKDAERAVEALRKRAKKLNTAPVEVGTIDGRKFARIRWSAETVEGMDEITDPVYGFVYVTDAGEHPIVVTGMGKADQTPILEAAAQTLQLDKADAAPRGPVAKSKEKKGLFR